MRRVLEGAAGRLFPGGGNEHGALPVALVLLTPVTGFVDAVSQALRWKSGASSAGASWLVAQFPAPLWGGTEPHRASPSPLTSA